MFGIKNLNDNADKIKAYYDNYNSSVVKFFDDTDLNFLKLDVTKDNLAYEKIVSFLGFEDKIRVNLPDGRVLGFNEIKGKNVLMMPHMNKAKKIQKR